MNPMLAQIDSIESIKADLGKLAQSAFEKHGIELSDVKFDWIKFSPISGKERLMVGKTSIKFNLHPEIKPHIKQELLDEIRKLGEDIAELKKRIPVIRAKDNELSDAVRKSCDEIAKEMQRVHVDASHTPLRGML